MNENVIVEERIFRLVKPLLLGISTIQVATIGPVSKKLHNAVIRITVVMFPTLKKEA